MRQMLMPGGGDGTLRQQHHAQQSARRDVSLSTRQGGQMKAAEAQREGMLLRRALKKKRPASYMNQIRVLDAGNRALDQSAIERLLADITGNLGPLDPALGVPSGIVAKCYLGGDYEVHTLNLADGIIEHYAAGHRLPGTLEDYRAPAINGAYEFIEVYSDFACAIRPNGAVTLIEAR